MRTMLSVTAAIRIVPTITTIIGSCLAPIFVAEFPTERARATLIGRTQSSTRRAILLDMTLDWRVMLYSLGIALLSPSLPQASGCSSRFSAVLFSKLLLHLE